MERIFAGAACRILVPRGRSRGPERRSRARAGRSGDLRGGYAPQSVGCFPRCVRSVAVTPDVSRALAAVEPPFYHYGLLKEALARYRKAARLPDLTRLPPVPKNLTVGAAYDGAPALRSLLRALGDLPDGAGTAPAD